MSFPRLCGQHNPDITYGLFRWQMKGRLFGKHEHGAVWLLICGAIEKHLLTYLWGVQEGNVPEGLSYIRLSVQQYALSAEYIDCLLLRQMIGRTLPDEFIFIMSAQARNKNTAVWTVTPVTLLQDNNGTGAHMAVHHPHYHHFHLLSLVQSFLLNLRLGSSANSFLHRLFRLLPDWLHGLSDHLTFFYSANLLNSWICLHGVLD